MEDKTGPETDREQVTFIETDIDCLQSLEEVRSALITTSWVDEVEMDASAGCLVVRHHGVEDDLSDMVGHLGHRLTTTINGEVMMDTASVALPKACPVGHVRAMGEWR